MIRFALLLPYRKEGQCDAVLARDSVTAADGGIHNAWTQARESGPVVMDAGHVTQDRAQAGLLSSRTSGETVVGRGYCAWLCMCLSFTADKQAHESWSSKSFTD
jgi:hypothetical protein